MFRAIIAVGYAVGVLAGPLCSALMHDSPPVRITVSRHGSMHHHASETSSDPTCASHCLDQARDFVVSSDRAVHGPKITAVPPQFHISENAPWAPVQAMIAIAGKPDHIPIRTVVLRL